MAKDNIKIILYSISIALLLASFKVLAQTTQRPFIIITNDWPSQIVFSHIAGELLRKSGTNVKYSSFKTEEQWGALGKSLMKRAFVP